MVKEEKTIDGFPVRGVKDSALVARSKANKLPSNRTKKKVKAVTENDPLVKRSTAKSVAKKTTRKVAKSVKVQKAKAVSQNVVAMDMKPAKKRKKISRAKTTEMFTAEPEAFNLDVEAPEESNDIEIFDEEEEFRNEVRDERLEEELFGNALANEEAHEEFLAPVETFDMDSRDAATEDGMISEVGDEEVKDMKKSKRELKENAKRAKVEQKRLAKLEKIEKKKKKSKVGKFFKWFFIILLILAVGAGVYLYFWGDGIIKKITGGKGDIWSAIGAVTSETYEPLKTDANGRTNILVFGTSGFDAEGSGFGGYEHDGSNLTDSIMVVSLDQEAGDVAIVSLPRDLYAKPTCTATGKVNEVYYCGKYVYGSTEEDGAKMLQDKIKEILDIDTQYWVHMNWGALVNIVDAVGGVTITLDEDIDDQWYTGAVYQAGVEYTINGFDALALSRARHGTAYGDFSRAASQQKILIGIKNKVVEKGLGLSEALSMISAVGDNLTMNFEMSELKTGMHLLETFDLDSIRQIPLWDDNTRYMTFANEGGISYIAPVAGIGNYAQVQQYLAQQLKSNPTEREGAVIIVYNGTGEAGVAAQEQEMLEEKGFSVKEIANAPEGEYKYTEDIEIYDASEGLKPDTKKALEKYYGLEMKDMAELPNGISPIGYDFIIIVGSATASE